MVGERLFQTHSAGGSTSTGTTAGTSSNVNTNTNGSAGGAGGLKVKLKLNHPSATGTPSGGPAAGQQGEVYEGYKDLDEVKRDFDLIWGNAKRCKSACWHLRRVTRRKCVLIGEEGRWMLIDNQKESGIFKDAQKLHVSRRPGRGQGRARCDETGRADADDGNCLRRN